MLHLMHTRQFGSEPAHGPPAHRRTMHTLPYSATSHVAPPTPRRPPLFRQLFPPLLLLLFVLSCVSLADDSLPPVQHHVYFSGSHITSIALKSTIGELYVTDVVSAVVLYYNYSGRLLHDWPVITAPALYSPTSVAYVVDGVTDTVPRLLYVSDSTMGAVVKVNPVSGTQDPSFTLDVPAELWDTGLLLAVQSPAFDDLYVVDRYRGYTARVELYFDSQQLGWTTGPPPAPSAANLTATYLSSLTVSAPDESGVVYIVDGAADRVLRMQVWDGKYADTPFALPDEVKGILSVCWTWCQQALPVADGCLWVMYQPDRASGSARTVIAVLVDNGTVVYNWTTTNSVEQQRQQQQSNSNGHVTSPAMRVNGQGLDSDPFRVYLAEADPNGPGHVVVVRDENGTWLQQYDSIPLLPDATNSTMHAFTSVQAEAATCTLWLTDVDNGGMLVRTAADGTILQHFHTPALFSSVVLDSSNVSLPSLVLLFANASEWQLWRFYPTRESFEPIDTTSIQQQVSRRCADTDSCPMADGDVMVGGLDVDGVSGRLLLSLPSAGMLVLLEGDGSWNESTFNTTGSVVHPTLVAFMGYFLAVTVDRVGEQGDWHIMSFETYGGGMVNDSPLSPPMVQPTALLYASNLLWLADSTGVIFQIDPTHLTVPTGGMYQPMPAAYDIRSLAIDIYDTIFAVDKTSRRLILLFLHRTDKWRPSPNACGELPVPPSSSSSSSVPSSPSSSSHSSSSTGGDGPAPDSHGGLFGGAAPLIVGAVYAAVAVVLIALAYRYWWVRRRRSSGHEEDDEPEQEEEDVYQQWNDPTPEQEADDVTRHGDGGVAGEMESGRRSLSSSVNRHVPVPNASDSRYDAYVRLYEALSQAQDGKRGWDEPADTFHPSTAHGYSDVGVSQPLGSKSWSLKPPSNPTEPLSSSSSSSSLSLPSADRSAGLPSSTDSSGSGSGSSSASGSGSDSWSHSSVAAAPPPSTIARFSSRVVPRFIDRVTDLHILGEGQSGRVYCGVYEGSRVVVKQPKCRSMSAAQWREWQAHLRLPVHPNLVRFIGSLVMEDTNYLVLGWVEQGSLKSLLSAPTATRTARWYTRPYAVMRAAEDIASALQHVHQHGLVHRDVSARNVLVEADGTFVLADLGLAQEADALGRPVPPALAPTTIPLRWCSPEYLTTRRATTKIDVWALGVTLWECTSGGRVPYDDTADQSEIQRMLQAGRARLVVDPYWIQQHEGTDERGLVGRVLTVVECCLTVDVEQRPTAEQVVTRVQQEMAEWEAECEEEEERVRRQWADDHAATNDT